MENAVARLRKKAGVIVKDGDESWTVGVSRPPSLSFEIVVPHSVLEWFVTVKNAGNGKDIWNDWADYYADTGTYSSSSLSSQLENDIERFIETLLTVNLRVVESKKYFAQRQRIEWNVNGQWEKLALFPLA
jgi:hypothetical protein